MGILDVTRYDAPEQWRVIDEAPDYEISSIGRVRRCNPDWQGKYKGRILRPSYNRGYARHRLSVDGRGIYRSVHYLVCTAYNGPRSDPSLHCAHRDDNKGNNTPDNLYWATPAQNMADAIRNDRVRRGPRPPEELGRLCRGDDHWTRKHPDRVGRGLSHWKTGTSGRGAVGEQTGAAKLTEAQVREILAAPAGHGTGRALADRYGVSMGLISAIRKKRAWAYLHESEVRDAT